MDITTIITAPTQENIQAYLSGLTEEEKMQALDELEGCGIEAREYLS